MRFEVGVDGNAARAFRAAEVVARREKQSLNWFVMIDSCCERERDGRKGREGK
jgi:hypothetical protein